MLLRDSLGCIFQARFQTWRDRLVVRLINCLSTKSQVFKVCPSCSYINMSIKTEKMSVQMSVAKTKSNQTELSS